MGIQDNSTVMRGALGAVCLESMAELPLMVARLFDLQKKEVCHEELIH